METDGNLDWKIGRVDESNSSGTLDLSVWQVDIDQLFPIQVSFSAAESITGVDCIRIEAQQTGAKFPFNKQFSVTTDSFNIK